MERFTKRGWVIFRICAVYRMEAGTVTTATRERGSEMVIIITREPMTITTLVRMDTTSVAIQVLITSIS